MSQNLRNFTSAVYGLDAVVRRVGDDAWDAASPCEGWSARDVLGHASAVLNAFGATARTGVVSRPEPIADLGNPVAVWAECREQLLEALDRPGLINRQDKFWFGEMSFDNFMGIVQWDPLGHSWDIATAAGIDAWIDPAVAEASLEILAPMQASLIESGRIAQPIEVPADADAASRFLGAIGRNPLR